MLWQVKEGKSPHEVGSGVWLHPWMGTQDCEAARMHQEKQGSPTIVVTCLEPNHCSQQSSNVSWLKPSSTHQLTGDYGADQKWLRGCRRSWDERSTHDEAGTRFLRLGYSTRVPRPQHTKADEETQRTFKKLPEELEAIRQAYPQASVEL